ncbi:MAG: hypothetical protein HY270_09380 [Deltaproteobacteria bacterium]|nr:hypothetical protein [Deltaproteobacteria bacterium]
MIGTLHGPWLILAALLFAGLAAVRGRRPATAEILLIAGIFAAGLALRLEFGVWGPLHVNGQGPLWVRGTLEPQALVGYGPGYFELFNWMTGLGRAPDRTVFVVNALLSALSPTLLYATARLIGLPRPSALAAAVVLALDAVTIRTAASEGYYAPLIALVLGVQLSLGLAVVGHRQRNGFAAAAGLLGAGLFAAATARIHPMGYLPLALCPLVVLGAAGPTGLARRIGFALAAATAIAATVVVTSIQTILTALQASMAEHAVAPLTVHQLAFLLVLLAALWSIRHWSPLPWLPLLAVASLALMLATQDSFQEHPLQKLSYQRLFWPGVFLGSAALLPPRRHSLIGAAALATAAALFLLAPAYAHLGTPTTEQLEYRFLQEILPMLPSGCTIAAVAHADRRVWEIPGYLAPAAAPGTIAAQRAVERDSDLNVAPGDCLIYIRSSLCSSGEARALCDSLESSAKLERLASRVFPALPSFADLPYDRSQVETVVFRVTGRSATTNEAAPITPALAQLLYDRLTPLRATDGCRVVRLDTGRYQVDLGMQDRSGREHKVELATNASDEGAGRRVGGWRVSHSAETQAGCPDTLAGIERLLGELGK